MNKTAAAIAILAALLVACGDGSDSISDNAIVDDLTDRLRQENTQHFAFGCVDFDGTLLSGDPSPNALAEDAGIEHVADSWVSETEGVVLGGAGQQQYIVIYDPANSPTDAQEFDRREVEADGGALTCFVPK